MRIDKFIANSTPNGRKEVKQYIKKGQVTVNGKTVTDPGFHVDENNDEIIVCGEKITYNRFVYLMLNKPDGYISATFDKVHPVVTELAGEEYSHYDLFPVGRLDIDTHGLLLLTNDGELAHKLLSPKSHVPKTYYVKSAKPTGKTETEMFESGIKLEEDFITMPAIHKIISEDKTESLLTIYEGKFHQVKRMFEAAGNEVVYLKRISMGPLELDKSLPEGKCRPLTEEEIEKLKKQAVPAPTSRA